MQDVQVKLNPLLQWQKSAFNKKTLFAIILDLNLRKKLVKSYTWSTLHATKNRKVNWIGHILSSKARYWRIYTSTGVTGIRRNQLLDGFKERRGYAVESLCWKKLWTCSTSTTTRWMRRHFFGQVLTTSSAVSTPISQCFSTSETVAR